MDDAVEDGVGEGGDADPWGPNDEAVTGQGGRIQIGMVAGIKSERWPDCVGIRTHLQPIVALVAGVLILIVPRLLNYIIIAIFLILSGLLGLGIIR